jgi:hypothetical protein
MDIVCDLSTMHAFARFALSFELISYGGFYA